MRYYSCCWSCGDVDRFTYLKCKVSILVKLIMMADIVNPHQNSPVDFLFDLIDKFDHPAGRTNALWPDLTNSFFLPESFDGPNSIVEPSFNSLVLQGRIGILVAIFYLKKR